jgi:hypothetical protein
MPNFETGAFRQYACRRTVPVRRFKAHREFEIVTNMFAA